MCHMNVLGRKKIIIDIITNQFLQSVSPVNANLFEEGRGEVSSFDSHISQHPLLIGFLQNVLLHCALADQSEEER